MSDESAASSYATVDTSGPAAGSSASAASSYAIGLQEYGFTLTEVGRVEQIDATKLMFTHDATKATICFLKNSDPDRYFEIIFQTAPSDNTGKLHILEHAECAASDKYPGRNVFFYIDSNCYITQTNAGTFDDATRYFVASLDEDQLATGVDFYMDCAFHSAVATDEHYFKSEAWRYELDSPDADLSLTGVVYNEMKGAYGSMEDWSYYCVSEALFPDTAQRFSSGGLPSAIKTLKYEDLVAFYRSAYQPSNSTTLFYGDIDVERFLKVFDEEYFAGFDDASSTAAAMETQQPFDKPITATYDFPVATDSASTGSTVTYAVALPGDIGFQSELSVRVYRRCPQQQLQHAHAGPVCKRHRFLVYRGTVLCSPQFLVSFRASDADPTRADEFKQIVLDGIAKTIETGIDQDLIAADYAQCVLQETLVINQKDVGTAMGDRLARCVNSNRKCRSLRKLRQRARQF